MERPPLVQAARDGRVPAAAFRDGGPPERRL